MSQAVFYVKKHITDGPFSFERASLGGACFRPRLCKNTDAGL